jgi:hypothetical protein
MTTSSTHALRRLTVAAALAICVAALGATSALAGGNSSYRDGWYGWAVAATKANHQKQSASKLVDGRSPDTKDAALTAHALSASGGSISKFGPPDGWYPYAVALTRNPATLVDGRSPDTKDAGLTALIPAPVSVDGRSPDTIDAANLAHGPVVTIVQSPGFDWADFAIGIAAALGAMLLFRVSTTILGSRKTRSTSPVATA